MRLKGTHIVAFFLTASLLTPTAAYAFLESRIYYKQQIAAVSNVEPILPERYTLGFVGDIMMDRSVESKANRLHEGSFEPFFANVANELKDFDILFGNLEGPASDKGSDQGSKFSFRMNPNVLNVLENAGFDVLSVSNNHAFDWDSAALVDTVKRINDTSMKSVGGGSSIAQAYSPTVEILPDGTSVAFLALSQFGRNWMEASDNSPGIAVANSGFLKAALTLMKDNYDIVVVSFHYGDEYQPLPNKYQETISKLSIDAGADLVVGHHPHVLQPLEKYNDGYIAYSLGNFIFDQDFSLETMTGGILTVALEDKKIVDVFVDPTYQDPNYKIHKLNP